MPGSCEGRQRHWWRVVCDLIVAHAEWILLTHDCGIEKNSSQSAGRLRLSGRDVNDAMLIEPNSLSEPEDMAAALAAVELCRELGNSEGFRPLVTGETAPGPREKQGMIDFIRRSAVTYWHQSCTAKMGRDSMSVVDNGLKVYGIEGLRIAESSIIPRITAGNTMAPCVVIGERAADLIRAANGPPGQSQPAALSV